MFFFKELNTKIDRSGSLNYITIKPNLLIMLYNEFFE
jgi:hypothetical protein